MDEVKESFKAEVPGVTDAVINGDGHLILRDKYTPAEIGSKGITKELLAHATDIKPGSAAAAILSGPPHKAKDYELVTVFDLGGRK